MVICAVQHDHLRSGAPQGFGCREASKTSSDDYNTRNLIIHGVTLKPFLMSTQTGVRSLAHQIATTLLTQRLLTYLPKSRLRGEMPQFGFGLISCPIYWQMPASSFRGIAPPGKPTSKAIGQATVDRNQNNGIFTSK